MWKRIKTFLFAMIGITTVGAQVLPMDSICVTDTLMTNIRQSPKTDVNPHPWRALGEVLFVNGFIHGVDRYLVKEEYSKTSTKSFRDNIKSGFAWDDDNFVFNNFGHPCQGSLDFNAARSNGLNYWQSVPYTILGSISWEIFDENTQPSLNDVISTSVTGPFIGEVSHRMARKLIDESARGPMRFIREATVVLFNPVEEFNRLVSGRAWKVRRGIGSDEEASMADDTETAVCLAVGDRFLAEPGDLSHGKQHPFFSFTVEYGVTADGEKHVKPFDRFTLDGMLAFGGGQHFISQVHLMGRICSTPIFMSEKTGGELGLYQYYCYEDTQFPRNTTKTPFPFGEMASIGPGISFVLPQLTPRISFEQTVQARGVMLGAIKSDYYHHNDRTYNMGSGYGLSSLSKMTWDKVGNIQLKTHFMHLFTWKGYESMAQSDLTDDSKNYLNVLGDRSNARLLSVSLQSQVFVAQQFCLTFRASYFSRHTHYKYYSPQKADCFEIRAGVGWCF